jgi:hypothetical protein
VDELFNTEAKPLLGFLFKKVVLLQQAKQQMAAVIAALELQEETQRQQQVRQAFVTDFLLRFLTRAAGCGGSSGAQG